MSETWNFHIQPFKLFLILSILFVFILMDIKVTPAKDLWDECDITNITDLFPNGKSEERSFSSSPCHWFRFFAEHGVTYQIFTRPIKEGGNYSDPNVDTDLYLYYDPTQNDIANDDNFIENIKDKTSLIEWTCPIPSFYYICCKVKNFEEEEQGTYRIQITSHHLQPQGTIIYGVPDYQQSDFLDPHGEPFQGNCGPVAAACVLGYWDAHGYGRLVDADPMRLEDVQKLVAQLQMAMNYSFDPGGGVDDPDVEMGILRVCNVSEYDNGYDFKVQYYPFRDFLKVKDEITYGRPLLYGLAGHSVWGNHWMVTVGYLETMTTRWTINHDTWSKTHREIYVDWDEATESIVTIHPGKKDSGTNPIYSTPSSYLFTIPPIVPGINIRPAWGVNLSGLPTMLGALSNPFPFPLNTGLNTGYFNPLQYGTQGTMGYPNVEEGFHLDRVMSSNTYSEQFPSYGYPLNLGGGNSNFTFLNPINPLSGMNSLSITPIENMVPYLSFSLFPFTPFLLPMTHVLPYSMFSLPYALPAGPLLFGFPF